MRCNASIVSDVDALRAYLDAGGDPNFIPLYTDLIEEIWTAIICCPFWFFDCNSGRLTASNLGFGVVDEYGASWRLLHYAAYWDREEAIALLIEKGADRSLRTTNYKGSGEHTAYYITIKEDRIKSTNILQMLKCAAGVEEVEEMTRKDDQTAQQEEEEDDDDEILDAVYLAV